MPRLCPVTSSLCDSVGLGDDKSLKNHNGGLEWAGGKKLCNLDFADDIALIETSHTGMQKLSEEVEKMSGYVSLCMNAAKWKVLVSECWADPTAVMAEGAEVEVVEDFRYLESHISYQMMETVQRVQYKNQESI